MLTASSKNVRVLETYTFILKFYENSVKAGRQLSQFFFKVRSL